MKSKKLQTYKSKRHLSVSKEPAAKIIKKKKGQLQFVIQKHAARRLHYDFRLEVEGVLKSWAIPKGPSLDPSVKRLAIMVEDHPYAYKDFEGVIPEGYGAGTVEIWDKGHYTVDGLAGHDAERLIQKGLKKGEIHFFLEGSRLKGEFVLVRLKQKENEWLFIKRNDHFVSKDEMTTPLELKGIPSSRKPYHIKPMLCTLIDKPFDSDEWIFELKLDGYRALAEVKNNDIELYSRNLKSFNKRFPDIVQDLKKLKIDAIFDGEIVALDKEGFPKFQALQNQLRQPATDTYYYVFDILYLNGKDLRALPLIERKKLLKGLIKRKLHIRYLDHISSQGTQFLEAVKGIECEGIIGKKKDSDYKSGERSSSWVKIKSRQRQEAIICGFTEPRRSRTNFGSLILGVYKNGNLSFVGQCGGGFTERELHEIKELLMQDVQKKCPFSKEPMTNTKATWVKPKHLCEVEFSEWTDEGIMRQPVFMGLRDDKSAREVIKEKPMRTTKVVKKRKEKEFDFLTNLDKIYWPEEKITKGAMLGFYSSVAEFLIPFFRDRPQSLKRFPDGIAGDSFFQKNVVKAPAWISTVPIEHHSKTVNYLLIQDEKSLLYAANLGCIELHPWFSRYQNLDYPDFLVFDLDPEKTSFDNVVETALVLQDTLNTIGVASVCKTTGATGLHVCVPLHAEYTYEQAKQFAVIIATYVHTQIPEITSLERSPSKRQNKVYIDCFQNNFGQTIISPYSLRARPGAPVATPLDWKEVKPGLNPLNFNFFNTKDRLKKKGDLFKPVLRKRTNMKKALIKFEKL